MRTITADQWTRFGHAYAIALTMHYEYTPAAALLALRQLVTLAQHADHIRIDEPIRVAWAAAGLTGRPSAKAMHTGAAALSGVYGQAPQ